MRYCKNCKHWDVYHDQCKLTGEEVADHQTCEKWEADLTINEEKLKEYLKERSEKDDKKELGYEVKFFEKMGGCWVQLGQEENWATLEDIKIEYGID